ncbi:unnamed protein product [Anisakis simplex]|uniref:N-acetylglucosaminylphosphatidylinositol deacetylase n=1 Tax=Anisakis simplex TaxID=6269 RepID=A0A0M3JW60_ANISI|nr:unnamed protein product [Anisakis simplex]
MENATVSNTEHKSDNAKKIEQYFSSFTVTPKLVKILSGCAVGSFFGLGIRSALRHTRGSGHEKLGSAKLFGGVGVALRALGTATVLTCSGFGLLVIAVSAVLDVNTPRQFGHKMRLFCGDRLRLEKKESIATLSESPLHYNKLMDTLLSVFLLILLIVTSALMLKLCAFQQHALPPSRRALLITAHPDDETMFFGPTIQGLLRDGTQLYLLCLSTGDAYGAGARRKKELAKSTQTLGIVGENVIVLDYDNFKDGFKLWSKERLARVLLRHIQILDVDIVITFDGYGVSAHPNHISCFRALQYLYSNGLIPADVQVFVLESVTVCRKYLWLLDALISAVHSTFLYVSSPSQYLTTWRAMFCHTSQIIWFRYLYMAFSRYLIINTLKRIHLKQRKIVAKKKL